MKTFAVEIRDRKDGSWIAGWKVDAENRAAAMDKTKRNMWGLHIRGGQIKMQLAR